MPALAVPVPGLAQDAKPTYRKGKLKQAVCNSVFGRNMPLEERCQHAARLGVYGIDLLGPKDWPAIEEIWIAADDGPGLRNDSRGFQ